METSTIVKKFVVAKPIVIAANKSQIKGLRIKNSSPIDIPTNEKL